MANPAGPNAHIAVPVARLGLPEHFEGQANLIGEGATSEVWLCKRRRLEGDLEQVAVKIVKKPLALCSDEDLSNLSREAINQGGLNHHHVCQLFEVGLTQRVEQKCTKVKDSRERIYMVLEYAEAGTLVGHVGAHGGGPVSEQRARWFFLQLLSGLCRCHAHGVYHRNIEPNNCLITNGGAHAPFLKVTGFALSKAPALQGPLNETVGTPLYAAPEVLGESLRDAQGHYDGGKADVYGCGVTLAQVMLGQPPFCFHPQMAAPLDPALEEHRAALQANKLAGRWLPPQDDPAATARPLPEDLRDLLDGMLRPNSNERLDLAQVLAHPWSRRDVRQAVLSALDAQVAAGPEERDVEYARAFQEYVQGIFAQLQHHPSRQQNHL